MKANKLKEINGKKIRRQYLNIYIWFILALSFMTIPLLIMNTLWGDSGTKLNSWSEISTYFVAIVLISPLIIISFFNRFLFGKIVCVLSENGIHYLNGTKARVAKWENIDYIEYGIRMWPFFMTFDHAWCYARVIGDDLDVNIDQAPFMLIGKARKYNKRIKLKFEKTGLKFVALSIAIPLAVSLLLGLQFLL